jgi:hypothetical protein
MVANATAQRCEELAFVGKESRFFTMVFPRPRSPYTAVYWEDIIFVKASKFDRVITGGDQPDRSLFYIRAGLHILFAATILGLHSRPLLIDPDTFRALTETA